MDIAALRLPPDLAGRLDRIASRQRRDVDACIFDAIAAYIEDMEDLERIEERLAKPGPRKTLEELERELGLDR